MPATLSPDNPIAWAQMRLRGGWKNLLITGAAYGLLVGGGIFASAHWAGASPSYAYLGWVQGLLGLQLAVLLLFGTSRVTSAIRQDHSSRMIESHRLMPVSGGQAVVGYLTGSTSQAAVLAAVNLGLGFVVAGSAGFPLASWLILNLVVVTFCAFVWVLAALCAFLVRAPWLLVMAPMILVWMSGGMLLIAVPALTVLVSPLIGTSIFELRAAATEITPARAGSMLAQGFVAGVCFVGAARRFRRGDQPALSPAMGLLLLGGWVVISCAAIRWWDLFVPRYMPRNWVGADGQFVGSLLATMLLALAPTAALARAERDWLERAPDDPRPARRPPPGILLTLAATVISMALLWAEASGGPWEDGNTWAQALQLGNKFVLLDKSLRTTAVVFLFLLAAGSLLRILSRFGFRTVALFVVWLVLTWAGPLIGDVARYAIADDHNAPVLGAISTLGPPGALLQLWVDPSNLNRPDAVDTTSGIAVQALLALLVGLVAFRMRRRRRYT